MFPNLSFDILPGVSISVSIYVSNSDKKYCSHCINVYVNILKDYG